MKAGYTYLSDGTKARALDASGVGYDYLGSFTYTHDANNNTTLESVVFGGGRVRKNGSGYDVDYYITDHLGSVRAIVNASGTITEQNDYYPFGTRHPNGLTTLSGNRWRFSGKEEQDAAFGVPYSDFGARLYDRTAWTAIDPLAEKYYAVSPYVYCNNNPVILVDITGSDIYRYDDSTGELILHEHTDDPFDQIGQFRKDRRSGEYVLRTKRDGAIKTRMNYIEKGILKDGMCFFEDNYFLTGAEGQPSMEAIQSFLLDFSNMADKEVGGYYLSQIGEDAILYVTVGNISKNTATSANPGNPYSALKGTNDFALTDYSVLVNYHTHLSRFSDSDRLRPSSMSGHGGDIGFKERQSKNNPNMKFLIITNPAPFYY